MLTCVAHDCYSRGSARVFTADVLRAAQEEYAREGIDWSDVAFADNAPVLEALRGRPLGALPLLDDECAAPRGSDAGYVGKLRRRFGRDAAGTLARRNAKKSSAAAAIICCCGAHTCC